MNVMRLLLAIPVAVSLLAAATNAQSESPRAGAMLRGRIVAIDYIEGRMQLRERRNHVVDVYILPSTNIQGKATGYRTIADLKKGETVDVMTSVDHGRTNAEIIKLE